jgi:5-methylcytosine-specific restriction protein A
MTELFENDEMNEEVEDFGYDDDDTEDSYDFGSGDSEESEDFEDFEDSEDSEDSDDEDSYDFDSEDSDESEDDFSYESESDDDFGSEDSEDSEDSDDDKYEWEEQSEDSEEQLSSEDDSEEDSEEDSDDEDDEYDWEEQSEDSEESDEDFEEQFEDVEEQEDLNEGVSDTSSEIEEDSEEDTTEDFNVDESEYEKAENESRINADDYVDYGETKDGTEERALNLLSLTSDKFSLSTEVIKIGEIGLSEPTKRGRQKTMIGLTQSVKDMGILTPIHVMKVAEEDATEDYKYVLIDGLRRMFGAIKNGMTEICATVWDFEDKEKGMELLLPLSLMLNRQQKRQWSEVWDLYRILELQSAITPGTLEFLLQLEAGDAMHLKDVMLCDYSEVKEALLSGEKNLDACYKMLQKMRKDEDQLGKDDATGFGDTVDGAEEVAGDVTDGSEQLTDQDVLELLEMADNLDDDSEVSSDDFSDMSTPDSDFVDQQKVGERHPLDPALRQAVLARDDFTCRCCGMRMIGVRLGLIAVHHILPVHVGGKDSMNNLTTLCLSCHNTLHCLERNGGTIMMSEQNYNELFPSEKSSLKRALKLARIAIEADKRRGMSKEQIANVTRDVLRHPMPGVNLKENQAIYTAVESSKRSYSDGDE